MKGRVVIRNFQIKPTPVVRCEIEEIELEGDYELRDGGYALVPSVRATCGRCGHDTESYGTHEKSITRCLALMREECPRGEVNHYIEEDAE